MCHSHGGMERGERKYKVRISFASFVDKLFDARRREECCVWRIGLEKGKENEKRGGVCLICREMLMRSARVFKLYTIVEDDQIFLWLARK